MSNLAGKKRKELEILSVLGHELKAPLNVVSGYIHLLENENLSSDAKSMIKRCEFRIEEMKQLISELLDLTRLESTKSPKNEVEINMKKMIEIILEELQEQIKIKQIQVQTSLDGFSVLADPWYIETLLKNLISNAIKYNKNQGTIFIQCYWCENVYLIKVNDTGIGISEEDQKSLFRDFSRVKNEFTKNIEGTGLGLSIVRKMVKTYRGNILLESQWGQGTNMTLTLQLKKVDTNQRGI